MTSKTCIALALISACSFSVLAAGQAPFDPIGSIKLKWEANEVTIRVADQGLPTVIGVRAKAEPEALLELPAGFAQVDEIVGGPGQKAYVRGRSSPLSGDIVVIDYGSRPPRIIDHLWAFKPSISPDGRWLAFIKWYSPHGGDENQFEDQYKVYDITKAPQANRPPINSAGMGGPVAHRDVGQPLFARTPDEASRENFGIDETAAHHSVSRFFWAPDSSQVAFVDRQADALTLVIARLPGTEALEVPLVGARDVCNGDCASAYVDDIQFVRGGILIAPRNHENVLVPLPSARSR